MANGVGHRGRHTGLRKRQTGNGFESVHYALAVLVPYLPVHVRVVLIRRGGGDEYDLYLRLRDTRDEQRCESEFYSDNRCALIR